MMQAIQQIQQVTGTAKPQISPEKLEKINKTAQEFEAVFLNEMLKPMFEGAKSEDSAFGGSREEGIFQSLMVDEMSKSVAQGGGIGIAKHIRDQLIKLQEVPK
jgi:flagellar protein FlgJ